MFYPLEHHCLDERDARKYRINYYYYLGCIKGAASEVILTSGLFYWTPGNFDAIHVFELRPHPQPLISGLLSRSSSELKKKCICMGSSLQKAASSSFSFFVRHFLFFGLCLASAWLSSLGLTVWPRYARPDNCQTSARQLPGLWLDN